MKSLWARLLTRMYPRDWRDRYGPEYEALLEDSPGDLRTATNAAYSGLREHIVPSGGRSMNQLNRSFAQIVKKPSAFLPLAMSGIALFVLGVTAISGGLVPHHDEGAAAHTWQLLMAGQLPVLAFFAIKWLPRAPRESLAVLALQVGAALVAMSPVFLLHL
jgi:hypothetical protein